MAFDRAGHGDAGILGAKSNSNAAGLKALLLSGDDSLERLRRRLERRGLQLGGAEAVRFFDAATPAGIEQSFAVDARRLILWRRRRAVRCRSTATTRQRRW